LAIPGDIKLYPECRETLGGLLFPCILIMALVANHGKYKYIYKLTAQKGLKATLKALCTLQKDESGQMSSTNSLSNVTYGVNKRNEDSERECWLFGMIEDCV
jgi:hypothetical protein